MSMSDRKKAARELLQAWKGANYVFGLGCTKDLGDLARPLGTRAALVCSGEGKAWGGELRAAVIQSLAGITIVGEPIRGAAPNTPVEDVHRLADEIRLRNPEVIIAVGGGSGIDAVKAAAAIIALGDRFPLDSYYGVNQVTEKLQAAGRRLLPIVAVQLAASSSAHLTKYANITDLRAAQKMLIVDDAVTPPRALFDYCWTRSMSTGFTTDGALDGVSHSLEVLEGIPVAKLAQAQPVCLLGIELIVNNLKAAVKDPGNLQARETLGLGTDLGGYAIMIGGTNGAHLNSFSLVDLLPHGKACALMNPYYIVFFAPAIEDKLRAIGAIYHHAGYIGGNLTRLHGRDLGLAVAEGMIALSRQVGFPACLREVPGYTPDHVRRCLAAAKNPKLDSKLRNMPVPLTAELVDEYMGPILQAAVDGDLRKIRNLA